MKNRFNVAIVGALAMCFLLLGVLEAQGQVLQRNIADLANLAEYILVGSVVSVTDGIDANNLPYTEITFAVSESLQGQVGARYTFRQFGLLAPRDMGNGTTNLNVTPEGWPRFAQDEEVMVFLYQQAALTGLRTTVGLFQGKFTITNGQIANSINNQGLFDNFTAPRDGLTETDEKLLSTIKGSIPADAFVSFVRRGIENGWF